MTDTTLKAYAELIEKSLDSYIPQQGLKQQTVADAMRYSLLRGGKRLRGALVLEFARINGTDISLAIPYACAVEMIHAYSLIHDDLPCMDNDDYRRGKPTNHRVYGEGMAVLAGDGLLNRAFEVLTSPETVKNLPADRALKAAGILASNAGLYGMLGGQCIDVENDGKLPSLDELKAMHAMKTGALIKASCLMGCAVAGADEIHSKAAENYAERLGLAFQIKDDMLDIEGDYEKLGKLTGSDEKQEKTTYPALLGLEECRKYVSRLTEEAINELNVYEDKGFLVGLATEMENRDH